ncbi:MAG: hypothetical protein HOY71_47160 [Nonomuraea sp.]|nr:hypothetical protein [Nonomuraea sp.]
MTDTIDPRAGTVITVPGAVARLALRIRRNGVLLTGLVLVAAAVAAKAAIVQDAYFKEDDYEFVARAMESDLSFDYLTRIHFGQFMPGGFLLAWLTTRLHAYDWGWAAGSVLALHALAGLAVLRMLRVVFGRRPATLVPLVVFLVAPITVPALAWWAAGLNTVFLQVALPMAIASHWLHVRTGRLWHAVAAALWVLFGLLGFVKGFALPVLLFALTAIYHGGLRATLRRWLTAWAMYAGVLLAFGALYVQRSATSPGMSGLPIFDQALGFLWELLARTFATTVLGGPWRWFGGRDWGVASPPLPLVVASIVVLAALIVITSRYRRRAFLVWTTLLGYVLLADALPVLWGRVYLLGSFAGTDTRYVADAAPLLALAVGLVLLPVRGEAEPYRRGLPAKERVTGTAGALFGLFTGASLVTTSLFAGYLGAERRHDYIETARAELAKADPDAVIFDRLVPSEVLPDSYKNYSLTSRLLGAMATPEVRARMYAPPATTDGLVFDDQGHLRPVDVQGVPLVPVTKNRCWPATAGTVQVPLDNRAVRPEGTLVRLGYAAPAKTPVTLWMGDRAVDLTLHEGFGRIFVLAVPGADRIVVHDAPPGLCLGDVTPGQAVPRP